MSCKGKKCEWNWDKAVTSIKLCSGLLSSILIKPHMPWQTLLTQTSCILCYAIGVIKNTLTFDDWETIIMLNSCILYSVTGSCENLTLYNKWKAPWVVITVLSCTTLHMNNYQHQIVTTLMSSWLRPHLHNSNKSSFHHSNTSSFHHDKHQQGLPLCRQRWRRVCFVTAGRNNQLALNVKRELKFAAECQTWTVICFITAAMNTNLPRHNEQAKNVFFFLSIGTRNEAQLVGNSCKPPGDRYPGSKNCLPADSLLPREWQQLVNHW